MLLENPGTTTKDPACCNLRPNAKYMVRRKRHVEDNIVHLHFLIIQIDTNVMVHTHAYTYIVLASHCTVRL